MKTRVTARQKNLIVRTHAELSGCYGMLKCFLNYKMDHELLVAAILSAQCTDVRVNAMTPELFAKYKSVGDFADARLAEFEQDISQAGLFRSKAKNIIGACRMIVKKFNSRVPCDMASLTMLPGVGRKTANVMLAEAFKLPGFPVDTHVMRLLNRIGAVKTDDPARVEMIVNRSLEPEKWGNFSRLLIHHGRNVCLARKAQCDKCVLNDFCAFAQQKKTSGNSMGLFKKKFRNIKKLPGWLFWFPAGLLKLLKLTHRTRIIDPYGHIDRPDGGVVTAWHNRLLFFPVMFPKRARKRTVAIVSPSRDGQYIVDLIAQFQIKSLRGSSSKRGSLAQREAIEAITIHNQHVATTPDGPRGPKYHMSKGPIHLASITGGPIIPISVNYSSYWAVKSWDNFQIPKPWAKITLELGEGIKIPKDLNAEDMEHYRKIAEEAMMKITRDQPTAQSQNQ